MNPMPEPILDAIDAAPVDSRPESAEELAGLAEVNPSERVSHEELLQLLAISPRS